MSKIEIIRNGFSSPKNPKTNKKKIVTTHNLCLMMIPKHDNLHYFCTALFYRRHKTPRQTSVQDWIVEAMTNSKQPAASIFFFLTSLCAWPFHTTKYIWIYVHFIKLYCYLLHIQQFTYGLYLKVKKRMLDKILIFNNASTILTFFFSFLFLSLVCFY